ncbi:hypothetical protein [Streptomyces sp900105755]|uniref:Uncharacterized protein n=1 Tax=Streptomyces sp. 900105755 TaxID=3154389 RepID=A0ABV1TWK9_9ACTN
MHEPRIAQEGDTTGQGHPGTAIAAASGLVGCFLVLRAQVFTGGGA